MTKIKNVTSKIVTVILWIIVAVLIFAIAKLVVAQATGKPAYFGNYTFIRITSNSMINKEDSSKSINPGDYLLVKKVHPKDVKKNDVITFFSEDPTIFGKLNTHRVVEEPIVSGENYEFVTKGDNNSMKDGYNAKGDKLVGVVVKKLVVATALINALTYHWFVLVLVVLVVVLYVLITLFKGDKNDGKQAEFDKRVQEEIEKLKMQDALKEQTADFDKNAERRGKDDV